MKKIIFPLIELLIMLIVIIFLTKSNILPIKNPVTNNLICFSLIIGLAFFYIIFLKGIFNEIKIELDERFKKSKKQSREEKEKRMQ